MGSEESAEITPTELVERIRAAGVCPPRATIETRSLGGGVSNHVVEVRWETGCVVAKRPLADLAVEDDWPADVGRVHNEAAAARAYADILEDTGVPVGIPAVVFEDRDAHLIAIECAPEDAVMWKRELLAGEVDQGIPPILGTVLGTVQSVAANDPELRGRFADTQPFRQLRIEPYHRRTAERHPDVAALIDSEIERLTGVHRTLVHGDYSPKNVLVDRAGETRPWILDFEVAHWGDPAFDPAFMLNHLFIKSVYRHVRQSEYLAAARAFWDTYDENVPWDVEVETVTELGVLMLARIDGTSPVEYVGEGPIADVLRSIAKGILTDELDTVDDVVRLIESETETGTIDS